MSYCRTLKYIIVNSLVLLGLSISVANASMMPIVYNVDRMVGDGSVIGFIETDGTTGTLTSANIIDWELTLTAPGLSGSPDTIDFATREISEIIAGNATSATTTQLLFNFEQDGLGANYIFFKGMDTGSFWCLETKNCAASLSSPAESIGVPGLAAQAARSGQIVFAQVSAVPVPAAVWLFGTALIGLLGFGKRRKTV